MIPRIPDPEHTPAWQQALAGAVKSADELLGLLDIDPAHPGVRPLLNDFPVRVPHSFIRRMVKGDIHDPLLRQVLTVADEAQLTAGYNHDPLEEQQAMATPGLLHKYHGRALLTATGACAVHCRYCFRRHFPYGQANPASDDWSAALDYLSRHTDIAEIILSGGDPLSLTDRRLGSLASRLAAIPHLQTLRIHTRIPVVLPERINPELLEWLGVQRLQVVMVIHSNHPNEIDAEVHQAMRSLKRAGVTLLNQSVLLRGVNDDAATLVALSQALMAAGVLPYYLHQMDKVQGAAHFEVADSTARQLMERVHAALPGYLVPRLVRELPGHSGKLAL
ncbi:MAG: EF-P beta-lysylation protein EpmB [Gammaproteobacteria bacterium]